MSEPTPEEQPTQESTAGFWVRASGKSVGPPQWRARTPESDLTEEQRQNRCSINSFEYHGPQKPEILLRWGESAYDDYMSHAGYLLWKDDRSIRRFGHREYRGMHKYMADSLFFNASWCSAVSRFRERTYSCLKEEVTGLSGNAKRDIEYRPAVAGAIQFVRKIPDGERPDLIYDGRVGYKSDGPQKLDMELYHEACRDLPAKVEAYVQYMRGWGPHPDERGE